MFAAAFTLWGSPVTWLEIAAFVLSLAMVWANMRVAVVAWPLAVVSSLLYGLLFARSKLYGEAALQLLFIGVALWGWRRWAQRRTAAPQVGWMSARARWVAAGATLAAWPLLGLLLHHATDSDVPFLDALPTAASVTGQVLLGLKRVENWPLWVAVNAVSVGLFVYKQLWLTAILYAIFIVLAFAGWRAWRRLAASG